MQRILVFGASSQIGHFLLPNLLQHGADVWAFSRRAQAAAPHIHWLQGTLPDHVPDTAAPWDGIISAGPLAALAKWLAQHDTPPARAVVATSSMSVITKQASIIESERALMACLRAGEQALAQQCERLGISWTILRPTLIYGVGLDRNLTPLARALPAARGPLFRLDQDLIADNAELTRVLGINPRGVRADTGNEGAPSEVILLLQLHHTQLTQRQAHAGAGCV